MSGEGYDHGDLAMLKGKSGQTDQSWVSREIRVRIFGSFHGLAIFIVIATWISSPGYDAVMITSAYFLLNLLFMMVKFRKDKELKIIREQQVEELRKKQATDY